MFKLVIYILLSSLFLTNITAQKDIPELNKKVITYVKSVMGTTVDRGECWDLANEALMHIHAKWDGKYKYGEAVNPQKDEIFPGDIIQFENVKLKYQIGNTIYKETMAHHTAIVYKVLEKGKFELAHQNTGFSGRKVGVSKLDISTVYKGRMSFYRPIRS